MKKKVKFNKIIKKTKPNKKLNNKTNNQEIAILDLNENKIAENTNDVNLNISQIDDMIDVCQVDDKLRTFCELNQKGNKKHTNQTFEKDSANLDIYKQNSSNNIKKNIEHENELDSSKSKNNELEELKVCKTDVRYDYFESKIEKIVPVLRELNIEDLKRIKRQEKEEASILELHTDLIKQEEMFINGLPTKFEIIKQPVGLKTKLMDFQLYGVSWMKSREDSIVRGGILADEMGMGKTLQSFGLILSDLNYTGINLIITPAIALNQWISEVNRHASDSLIIVPYHGRNKKEKSKMSEILNEIKLQNPDKHIALITTYGTLSSEYRRKNGILFEIDFYRIIIDEAHSIKDSSSLACTAVSSINAQKRWGLTGTPVQNRIGDLYSLVKFLRLDPHSYYFCKKCPCKSFRWLNYDKKRLLRQTETQIEVRRGFCTCGHFGALHFGWWNRRITSQIKNYGYTEKGEEIFSTLKKISSHIILRRTKKELSAELGLPPKIVVLHRLYFSEQEKDFYTSLYQRTQRKFMTYAVTGQVNTHYMHIFELLQKMRLAVNHPFLALNNVNDGIPICGFCNEEADDPIISKCNHIFCREEARDFLQVNNTCPVCKLKITIDLNQETEFSIKRNKINVDNWTSSTKIEFLIQKLTKLKSNNRCEKSIVFSQFVNFLEMLKWRLERAGFRCVTIYGSMSISQRKAAIDVFNTDDKITIFLISLKAGGLALNLTEASNVFLMDLWWNPAVEEQAMDRIHRIGQHRSIKIHRLIIHDSIESRILKLQEKKKALFDAAIDNDSTAIGRLTEDDLFFLFAN